MSRPVTGRLFTPQSFLCISDKGLHGGTAAATTQNQNKS